MNALWIKHMDFRMIYEKYFKFDRGKMFSLPYPELEVRITRLRSSASSAVPPGNILGY
jgi:hypothetical protein